MIFFRAIALLLPLTIGGGRLAAQLPQTYRLALPEVVALAQADAPDMQLAETRLTNNFWRYRSFLANYKPQITFEGEALPLLNRSIEPITLPDGSEDFISRSFMRNALGLSISQPIGMTGGRIYAFTGLQRLDIFRTNNNPGSASYLSTPVQVGFVQPFFSFNPLRWDQQIEPLRYQAASRVFVQEKETVALEAARLFFDVLIAQLNLEATRKDKDNADTLLELSRGRFSVGRIAETDLLQIELSVMNADAALAAALLEQQSSTEQLRNYLGLTQAVRFELLPPDQIPDVQIDADRALSLALANRSELIEYERRAKEAEANVAQAAANDGFDLDVSLQFGLSQTAKQLGAAYRDLLDQEFLRASIRVPIADWGKARSRVEIARSNQELELMNIRRERVNFEREILLKVQQFDLLRQQVDLAERAFEVARRREDITRKRYLIGMLQVIELNQAVRELDEARRRYFAALRDFWLAYYDIRRLTLHDFLTEEPLFRE